MAVGAVPDLGLLIVAGRGDATAVGCEHHGVGAVGVRWNRPDDCPFDEVPEPEGSILGGRGQQPAIGRVGRVTDRCALAGQHLATGPACRVPDVDDPVPAAGGQGGSIGGKGQADVAEQAGRAAQALVLLAGARVPDPDVSIVGRGDAAAVGRERHGPHPARAVAERHLGIRSRRGPELDGSIQAPRRGQGPGRAKRHAVHKTGMPVKRGVFLAA